MAAEGTDTDVEAAAVDAEARRAATLDDRLARGLDRRPRATGLGAPRRAGYLRSLQGVAPLEEEGERELVATAQSGDERARERLIEAFMPRIAQVARLYRTQGAVERTELLQEGVVGLLRALERYKPERGIPFWAYAAWWVRQGMQQLVSELARPVVLSDRALRQLARVKDAHGAHLREHGREPSASELGARSGLPVGQVQDLLTADRAPRGLEAPVVGEEGSLGVFGELLNDPLAEEEYERVLDRLEAEELRELLTALSDRERMVLSARHGLDRQSPASLADIGARLGVSAERVRQLERRALAKLTAGGR